MIQFLHVFKKIGDKTLFSDLCYQFPDTGLFVIQGDNATGKTTLFHMMTGCDKAYQGKLLIQGKDVKTFSCAYLQKFRQEAIVYFKSQDNLIESLTLKENLDFFHIDSSIDDFSSFDLSRYPSTLSGGEELVFLLKALTHMKKQIILLDECSSNLDENHFSILQNKLQELAKTSLVILATHDNRMFPGIKISLHDKRLFDQK